MADSVQDQSDVGRPGSVPYGFGYGDETVLRSVDDEPRPREGVKHGGAVRPGGHRGEACHHPVRAGPLDDQGRLRSPFDRRLCPDEFLRETREQGFRARRPDLLDRIVPPATGGLAVGGGSGGEEAEGRDRVRAVLREGQRDITAEAVSGDRNPPGLERLDELRDLLGVRLDRRPAELARGTVPATGEVRGEDAETRGGDAR